MYEGLTKEEAATKHEKDLADPQIQKRRGEQNEQLVAVRLPLVVNHIKAATWKKQVSSQEQVDDEVTKESLMKSLQNFGNSSSVGELQQFADVSTHAPGAASFAAPLQNN